MALTWTRLAGIDRSLMVFCLAKEKNFAMIPGNNYYNFNGSASSSSTTSFGVPQWGHSYETLQQAVDATNFAIPEFEGISHRTVQSGSIANASIQPELAFLARQNIFLPRSYTMQTFQPSNNAWFPQYGDGSNIGDGSSSRDKKNTVRYLQGACPNSGPLEVPPVNMQAYASSSSGASSAMLFRQPAMSNFHTPVQNMHVRSYRPHANIPVLPQHRITNLHSSSSRTGDVIDVGATFSHFPCGQFPPSSVDQLYWYQQLPRPAQQFNNGNQRFPPAEDATLMDLSALYGTRNAIDQHQDMRLDIDDMSYEELLALEERIGIVKTGLTEEFIARNLKTKVHVPKIATSTSEPSFRLAMENEDCAVCQVEYLENDIIGSLDCAHSYHADCIKQWLLIKNLCPICKTSALISNGEMK
ncbi:hypothetical protein HPP92_007931 [Vanilla planifolia]|uniref:RING-type E3 ubiquitin transferase n=1 Tax=Vanilla planifolia TaxID=51239 RepID=A0A835RIF8_VANPL|nr:hypothetical protein HPP92_007931 [Vanilla planifolia]